MRFKYYFLLVLLVTWQQWVNAQNDLYKFSHLDITNGLSDNQVHCIFKDNKGYMWFGTTSGLNRYDGYKFKIFKHDAKNASSLGENHVLNVMEGPDNNLWIFTHSSISIYNPTLESFSNNLQGQLKRYGVFTNTVTSVKKDKEGHFWFITGNGGLYCYNPDGNFTVHYYSNANGQHSILHSNDVADIAVESANLVWLVYKDGFLEKLDTRSGKIVQQYNGLARDNNYKKQSYLVTIDNTNKLWIYSDSGTIGVFRYNTIDHSLLHFSKDNPFYKLNSNVINSVVQADDHKIWIGTDHGGINMFDPNTNKVTYLLNKDDDPKSLSGNSIVLYKDNAGIIWAGTFKQGINYYHRSIMQFPLVSHFTTDKKSLPYNDINCFAEEAGGNLWIGTNGGGLIYFNRAVNTYTQYRHDVSDINSLSNDIITRLYIDRKHRLWIGTYFGGLDYFDGSKFIHHRHNDRDPGSVTDDRVTSILEDSKQRLWIGTFTGGLNIYNYKRNDFKHPDFSLSSAYTAVLYEDRQKNIWIGRDRGVDVIDNSTSKIRHYVNRADNRNSLVANDINIITQDTRGLIWIGTKDGLSVLNPVSNKFLLSDNTNLLSNDISNILEDNSGIMWISTNNGIAKIEVFKTADSYRFKISKFNEFDGLQGREFNLNAAIKLKDGELIFGGGNGFNKFDPAKIGSFKPDKNLLLTDLQLFNKSVAVGDTIKGKVILQKSISETKTITLDHDENVFSIGFAACDYFSPDKIKYQYTLENFDKGWITSPVADRKAIYTNLDAGNYVFKVKAQNTNSENEENLVTLSIRVLPPFWKSPLAYIIYLLIGVSFVFYLRHRGITKLKRQFELRQSRMEDERKLTNEREEARQMHQLDLMKIKFFTNVSHEFRTPLSLILSPIDDLIKNAESLGGQHQLTMIKRNGKRLLNLVNQLLDFRKMEYNELKLSLAKGDIIKFIKEVSSSFTDVAHQKHIQYVFECETFSFITKFDHDKIERIFFNLLSNAFKFTPSGGHISVILSFTSPDVFASDQKNLAIKIIDTGIGIPKENHEKIFERFYQVNMPESLLNQGSGIGLSITKEFVKMHGGTIEMESEPSYGTCFSLTIPVDEQFDDQISDTGLEKQVLETPTLNAGTPVINSAKKQTILLVEDNDDLRFYLKDNLKQSFHVIEAVNGKDGWQKALALHPQLIVSDVNMPEMNGLDLCRKIKEDTRTAHIPIILLTALTGDKEQLVGLENGANDYIVKPFNFEILQSKIQNLLLLQQTLKKTYQKQVEIQASDITIISEDDKFMKSALACIEANITNTNFSVEELAKHLNLSRVSLYKKLLALTGKSPVDCIRTIRLKRAVQLLEKSKLSIANIGYEVGFNNPAYFAKVFKEEFGILPSEYIIEFRSKEKETMITL